MVAILTIWDRGVSVEPPTPTPTLPAAAVAASAVPTATATTRPSPTPHTYVVQPGDTMNGIALELGVSAEALMDANGLTDPDTLSAGQVLIVPDGAAPAQEPTASAAPEATQESGEEAPQVEIRGVSGSGDLDSEVVRLLNSGGTARMEGWTLADGEGNVFTFPDFTLHSGAVSVHTRSGTNTVIDLYWGLPEPVWTAGKTITLRDAEGEVQSTFTIPGS